MGTLYEQNQPGAVVVPQKRDRRLQESPEDTVGFTMYNWTNDEEGIDGAIAVAVFDDYAVLKVDSGFEYGPELMYDAWNQLSSESATKNVTKLIIGEESIVAIFVVRTLRFSPRPSNFFFSFSLPLCDTSVHKHITAFSNATSGFCSRHYREWGRYYLSRVPTGTAHVSQCNMGRLCKPLRRGLDTDC